MRPKTKLQVEVINLSKYLPDIEGKMLSWAKTDCLKHQGNATKNRVICMDCGQRFSTKLVIRQKAVCPHCGAKLTIEQTSRRKETQHIYIAYATLYNEFQVIRNFEIFSYHHDEKPVKYYINEILQHWIQSDKKREVIAQLHTVNYMCDTWSNWKMEIRNKSDVQKYDVYPFKIHPGSKFKPEHTKYGIDHNLSGLTLLEAITDIPKNQKSETLLKAKQYSLLSINSGREGGRIYTHWDSIKISMRNKYAVKDAGMWLDYLDLLSYFRKDLHNSFYVCPKNLKKEHDKLVFKKRNVQRKEDEARKRKKAIESEAKFLKLKSQFFGLVFSDDTIKVKVIESIDDYMKEGDIMHHCVFTNEYFLKPESLVLSAQINNESVETVEVSLNSFKVIQSRGRFNKDTEYHDRIIKLVNQNINKIRKRKTISA